MIVGAVHVRAQVGMRCLQTIVHNTDANADTLVAIPHGHDIDICVRHARALAGVLQVPLLREQGVIGNEALLLLARELRFR